MSLMVIGIALGDRRQEFQHLIVAASEVQCIRDVRVNEDRNGIDFPCLLQLREGFVEPAHCVEVNDIPAPGQPVAGTQRERSLEAAFGGISVEIGIERALEGWRTKNRSNKHAQKQV